MMIVIKHDVRNNEITGDLFLFLMGKKFAPIISIRFEEDEDDVNAGCDIL